MRVHPQGHRPVSFYGPDDDMDGLDWRVTRHRIREDQRQWDAQYLSMSFISRMLCSLAGEITEPVGTSEGEPLAPSEEDL